MSEQTNLAERLQTKILERFETLLDEGKLSPTDAATLARLLTQNGWSFDETRLPRNLRDRLTKSVEFDDVEQT